MAKWTPAGKFIHQVVFWEDRGTGQTTSGQHVESWSAYANSWASFEPFTGKDVWQGSVVAQSTCTHVIKAYWRPNVKAQDIVVFRGRVFNIGYVFDIEEMHREMWIYATETLKPTYDFILKSSGDPIVDSNGFAVITE